MRRPSRSPARSDHRPGKILVFFAILLPVLLGLVGLVIDTGLLWAAYRQTQNTADAAALAAALDKMRGNTNSYALATANTFVTRNSPTSPALTLNAGTSNSLNIPPKSGPYTGNVRYVEVYVSRPVQTTFIQILGINRNQEVAARAVAGYEPNSNGEGAIVLDPAARPGLSVSGGATLQVDGNVIINSGYTGENAQGDTVTPYSSLTPGYAAETSNNGTFKARYIQVVGGVDVPANFQNYDTSNPDSPLFANYQALSPDPLRDLPTPTSSNVTSITNWTRIPAMTVNSGQSVTLNPGVYEDINILQNTTVTLNPGVYILSPTKPNQGFRTNGSTVITGNGVMIYATGSDYLDTSPGYWDAQDDAQNSLDGPLPPTNSVIFNGTDTLPAAPDPNFNKVSFATVDINANSSTITLSPVSDTSDPFYNVLFFQRRRNTNTAQVQGKAGEEVKFTGTIYAKWANFKLAGGGNYDAQFVVGSMAISGQATVSINSNGKSFGLNNQVYLVE